MLPGHTRACPWARAFGRWALRGPDRHLPRRGLGADQKPAPCGSGLSTAAACARRRATAALTLPSMAIHRAGGLQRMSSLNETPTARSTPREAAMITLQSMGQFSYLHEPLPVEGSPVRLHLHRDSVRRLVGRIEHGRGGSI